MQEKKLKIEREKSEMINPSLIYLLSQDDKQIGIIVLFVLIMTYVMHVTIIQIQIVVNVPMNLRRFLSSVMRITNAHVPR